MHRWRTLTPKLSAQNFVTIFCNPNYVITVINFCVATGRIEYLQLAEANRLEAGELTYSWKLRLFGYSNQIDTTATREVLLKYNLE